MKQTRYARVKKRVEALQELGYINRIGIKKQRQQQHTPNSLQR
jgi:hypothetical protein